MKIEELEKQLNSEKLDWLYLLYGEETFLLESCLKKMKKLFGQTIVGINYITIDETNIANLINDIGTPAFGYEKKLIIVKNANLFKKEAKRKSAKTPDGISDKIASYIKENSDEISQSNVLIFIDAEVEKNELYNSVEKLGAVCNFEKLKPISIIKRLKSIANAYKVNVDESTLDYLIQCCGTSMQDLINEIRKLIEFAGDNGKITKEDIDKLCIQQTEAVIFELTDNLGNKQVEKALNTLHSLISNKEPIQRILTLVYNHFKKLYIVKLAQKSNKNIAESLNLKPNQMFLTTKYQKQAGYFQESVLRKILEELYNLDANYKSGLIDLQMGLEAIWCNYCS